jgi:DNA-binding CsgD family transcriptional regulator
VRVVDLTDREWDLLEAMRAHKTPQQIAAEWGTKRSNVNERIRDLQRKGVIRRRSDLPIHTCYAETYPWVFVEDIDVRYKPALPPEAEFRVKYPTDSRKDMSVSPIRFVRWDSWTVQGLPACRPDGQQPRDAAPDRIVVWCQHGETLSWCFTAALKRPWLESFTDDKLDRPSESGGRRHSIHWSDKTRQVLTQMIAAAIGVKAVMDLSVVGPDRG